MTLKSILILVFHICLLQFPTYLHAQVQLSGTYKLDSFEVKGNEISITLWGRRIPLCESKNDHEKNIDLLKRVMAGSKNIEIYSSDINACIFDISATPSREERIALVESALKAVLPNSELRFGDFDSMTLENSQFPEMKAKVNYLYVPYDKIGVSSITVSWRKQKPGDNLHYYVSEIKAYRNLPDELGYQEINQGVPDFENIAYTSNRLAPDILDAIRVADRRFAMGILKKFSKRAANIVVLEKMDAWLAKRIVHGECSGDREIKTMKINKATRKVQPTTETKLLYGGECPD